jgi:hypothetical protein
MNWIASNQPVATEIKYLIGRGPYGSRPILMVEPRLERKRAPVAFSRADGVDSKPGHPG